MRRLWLIPLATILLAAQTVEAAFDPAAFREKYVAGTSFQSIGSRGAEARNVDGLPGDEVLIVAGSTWQILRWSDSPGELVQFSFHEAGIAASFGGNIVGANFVSLTADSSTQVVMLTEDGVVSLFDPDGILRSVWKPSQTRPLQALHVANVDQLAGDELLIQTTEDVTAWKFGSTAPLWTVPTALLERVFVAQADSDSQPELILGTGTIYDTRSMKVQWRYPLGFGAPMAVGDLDGDGRNELVVASGRSCTSLDVEKQRANWQVFLPYATVVSAILIGDSDGDGRQELFTGDGNAGFVRKLDGSTGATLEQFAQFEGVNFLLATDLNGDCRPELVWAVGASTTGPDKILVSDAATLEVMWTSVPEVRGASGIAFGDFGGNGSTEVIWNSGAGELVRFLDFRRPGLRRYQRSTFPTNPKQQFQNLTVAAQLDGDPQLELVLPVALDRGRSDAGIYDGLTGEMHTRLPGVPSDSLTALAVADLTGDAIPEIILGNTPLYLSPDHPPSVLVFDGATHKLVWKTTEQLSTVPVQNGIFCLECVSGLLPVDFDLDGKRELLVHVPSDGLFAYSGQTGRLLWHRLIAAFSFTVADVHESPGMELLIPYPDTLFVVEAVSGSVLRTGDIARYGPGRAIATYDFDGDGQREIVMLGGSELVVFSGRTLEVLWSGGQLFPDLSWGNQILFADVDGDSTIEVVVPSAHSLHVFEYRQAASDTTAPVFSDRSLRGVAGSSCCSISLDWEAATDSASMPARYRVYRSLTANFEPRSDFLIGETTETEFVDQSLVRAHTFHYAVSAVDGAGNESPIILGPPIEAPDFCPSRRRSVRR